MGALHDGHLALIRKAASYGDDVIVSVYVNPTQFGVNEDLKSYPETWDVDMKKFQDLCEEFKGNERMGRIMAVFAPKTGSMYPGLPPTSEVDGHGSFVTITPMGTVLEGASRPVFFRGVATVCMKLFNIVQPDRVYFGEKDIQQCMIIKRMIDDFHINTQLHIVPTSRESDGLAMSSRNMYLGQRRRAVATVLSRALRAAESAYLKGTTKRTDLIETALHVASTIQSQERRLPKSERARFEMDYVSVANPHTMRETDHVDKNVGAILSGALKMLPLEERHAGEDAGLNEGQTTVRLIDNVLLSPDKIKKLLSLDR